ncbi:MAG: HNH endonuclease [Planctomycetes bacterium]|nr:HNH endonuclease [Planctomycetota bacterium]
MKITVDLSSLEEAVRKMGAENIGVDQKWEQEQRIPEPIDIDLKEGLDIALKDVAVHQGLLQHHGRQILLYIQDHKGDVEKALKDGSAGRKYHVADCITLQMMRASDKFHCYVATNDLSGQFYISGFVWMSHGKEPHDGKTRLQVCMNCLKALNYRDYNHAMHHWEIRNDFSLAEFFSTYSSLFPYLPTRMAGDADDGYTADWPEISRRIRQERSYTCEACGVVLTDHKYLLHLHHKNRIKHDNDSSNLIALCADCHRKEPYHKHLFVTQDDTRTINQLRQPMIKACHEWDAVVKMIDPALQGVAMHMQKLGYSVPELDFELLDQRGVVVAQLEMAWSQEKKAIAIRADDIKAAKAQGWQVLTMPEAVSLQ